MLSVGISRRASHTLARASALPPSNGGMLSRASPRTINFIAQRSSGGSGSVAVWGFGGRILRSASYTTTTSSVVDDDDHSDEAGKVDNEGEDGEEVEGDVEEGEEEGEEGNDGDDDDDDDDDKEDSHEDKMEKAGRFGPPEFKPSLNPKDYAFADDNLEDMWDRVRGLTGNELFRTAKPRARGYSKNKERMAKKFVTKFGRLYELENDEDDEAADHGYDLASEVDEGKTEQDLDDDDELEKIWKLKQQEEEEEGASKDDDESDKAYKYEFNPEARQLQRELEKEKKWEEMASDAYTQAVNMVDYQRLTSKFVPDWYPHVDEYEGDGYDDYTTTMQNTMEDEPPFLRDYEYDEKEFKDHFTYAHSGNRHILHVGRHTKTTKGGRVFSFSATMIDGNGQGRAGWGYGKGPTLSDAVVAAQKDCERNSFYIDRWKGHCITESIRFSYKKCHVDIFALPEGRTRPFSSQVMQLVFNAFGLKYVAGKWRGSSNKTKRIKTLFMALQQVEHPDYLSEKLGMKLFKPRRIPRKHGRVWSYD